MKYHGAGVYDGELGRLYILRSLAITNEWTACLVVHVQTTRRRPTSDLKKRRLNLSCVALASEILGDTGGAIGVKAG